MSFTLNMVLLLAAHIAVGQSAPEIQVGQSIADQLRSAASSDLAIIASGHLKDKFEDKVLSNNLSLPNDEVWLINLTGQQIRQGFDRSVAFYPQPCGSFLHISGAEVTFSNKANNRIDSVTINGNPLDPKKVYTVAMPSSLARGGLGYFSIWEVKVAQKVIGTNIGSLLAGKVVQSTTNRWLSKGLF